MNNPYNLMLAGKLNFQKIVDQLIQCQNYVNLENLIIPLQNKENYKKYQNFMTES